MVGIGTQVTIKNTVFHIELDNVRSPYLSKFWWVHQYWYLQSFLYVIPFSLEIILKIDWLHYHYGMVQSFSFLHTQTHTLTHTHNHFLPFTLLRLLWLVSQYHTLYNGMPWNGMYRLLSHAFFFKFNNCMDQVIFFITFRLLSNFIFMRFGSVILILFVVTCPTCLFHFRLVPLCR